MCWLSALVSAWRCILVAVRPSKVAEKEMHRQRNMSLQSDEVWKRVSGEEGGIPVYDCRTSCRMHKCLGVTPRSINKGGLAGEGGGLRADAGES